MKCLIIKKVYDNKVEEVLIENSSPLELCQNTIIMINNRLDISETIVNEEADSYIQSIIEISKELDSLRKYFRISQGKSKDNIRKVKRK